MKAVAAMDEIEFVLDAPKTLQEQLAEVSKGGSLAWRNALVGEQVEDAAKHVIDVGAGLETARNAGEILSGALDADEFALLPGMEVTEGRMGGDARYTAAAVKLIVVLAARRVIGLCWCGHEISPGQNELGKQRSNEAMKQ